MPRSARDAYWVCADGQWMHRPPWKCRVNRILRAFQRGPRKWVIASVCDTSTVPPTVLGYELARITHA